MSSAGSRCPLDLLEVEQPERDPDEQQAAGGREGAEMGIGHDAAETGAQRGQPTLDDDQREDARADTPADTQPKDAANAIAMKGRVRP